MKVKRVRVGEVLALQRREVGVEPDAVYEEIGVRSFGRGIFHKEPVSGVEIGSKRVFRIEAGDLVLSNVFAWEGAIAVASNAETGRIGSHRFMTFTPRDGRISTSWARWWFLSEPGLELIGQASPGSAGRNRTLAIDRFEAIEIPLPPTDDQGRVASHLDNIRVRVAEMMDRSDRAASFAEALADASSRELIQRGLESGWPLRPLSEVAEVNPRPASLEPEAAVAFVPMAAVDAASGSVVDATTRHVRDIGAGYKQFRRGDVIFARITPCMQNGKSAVFDEEGDYGYGSTEFHVLRSGGEVLPRWLHTIVRTRDFRNAAAKRFTGTAGQQRVPADFLRSEPIPVPTRDIQVEVMATMAARRERFEQLDRSRARSLAVTAALMPAALNQAFAELS